MEVEENKNTVDISDVDKALHVCNLSESKPPRHGWDYEDWIAYLDCQEDHCEKTLQQPQNSELNISQTSHIANKKLRKMRRWKKVEKKILERIVSVAKQLTETWRVMNQVDSISETESEQWDLTWDSYTPRFQRNDTSQYDFDNSALRLFDRDYLLNLPMDIDPVELEALSNAQLAHNRRRSVSTEENVLYRSEDETSSISMLGDPHGPILEEDIEYAPIRTFSVPKEANIWASSAE